MPGAAIGRHVMSRSPMPHLHHAGVTGGSLPGSGSDGGIRLRPEKEDENPGQGGCFPKVIRPNHERVYCRGLPARQSVICVTQLIGRPWRRSVIWLGEV